MNKNLLLVSFFILLAALPSCTTFFNGNANDVEIAVVGNKKLYQTELAMVIPTNLSEIDSISFAQNYIEKWVRNRLMLEKAELNLDKKALNEVKLMVNNYETSLLVYQYQQLLVQQKLDTIITDNNIEEYYAESSGNFKLDSCVVKAIYVKLPKSLPDVYNVRQWIRSSREADIISLEDYCYQNARNFDMGENWIYFSQLLQLVPKRIKNQENYLKYNRYMESSDSLYKYFIGIMDYKLPNDTTPIDFVKPQIRNIILNHRKMKFINDLENNIYRDAVNQKRFTIHAN